MPALQRGLNGGDPGVRFATVSDLNGAQSPTIVPAVVPLSPPYPVAADGTDATPVTATSGAVANAVATATIPGVAGKTAYIAGFDITGGGATAASLVGPTVTGTISGTLNYTLGVVAGAALMNPTVCVTFNPPIPASAVNTAIAASCPALGAGNTRNTVNVRGFYI